MNYTMKTRIPALGLRYRERQRPRGWLHCPPISLPISTSGFFFARPHTLCISRSARERTSTPTLADPLPGFNLRTDAAHGGFPMSNQTRRRQGRQKQKYVSRCQVEAINRIAELATRCPNGSGRFSRFPERSAHRLKTQPSSATGERPFPSGSEPTKESSSCGNSIRKAPRNWF